LTDWLPIIFINTFSAGLIQAVHVKTAYSHMVLCKPNSSTVSARELFKCSKDLASLVVCNDKKIFLVLGFRFFVGILFVNFVLDTHFLNKTLACNN